MSQNALRRYFFCEYESLAQLDFDQLDKVCERLFILISSETQSVPFGLVRLLQQLGPSVKWVVVDQQPGISLSHHLTFLLGRLHQKLPSEIQFAVLSEDMVFDPLIRFINEKGRSSIRVQREKATEMDVEKGVEKAVEKGRMIEKTTEAFAEKPLSEAEKGRPEAVESSAVERVKALWLENDLAPVSVDSEKN